MMISASLSPVLSAGSLAHKIPLNYVGQNRLWSRLAVLPSVVVITGADVGFRLEIVWLVKVKTL